MLRIIEKTKIIITKYLFRLENGFKRIDLSRFERKM